jgi:hypothetical protein
MKKIIPFLCLVVFLLSAGFFFSLVQNQQSEIADLQTSVTDLKKQIATLQLLQARQRRTPPTVITRVAPAAPTNSLKDRVFKLLYEINGNASSENASVAKKIRYLPGQLIVQDLEVVKDDRFFDLLGILLDEDAVKKVELPVRARAIKTELIQFGLSTDFLSNSSDGKFRININNFKD